MIFQLSAFSLYLSVLLLAGHFLLPLWTDSSRRARPMSGNPAERLGAATKDAIRTYLLLAPYALLAYLQGKPDLLPQYLAWIVFGLTVLKALFILTRHERWALGAGVVNLALLIFLWIQQLPFFQPAPA